MTIDILYKNSLNETIQIQIKKLYKQLNSSIEQLDLELILKDDKNIVFVICKDNEDVVGIAMMAIYKVISGHKGIIEDVVVDEKQRGKGIGRKLLERLLLEGKNQHLNEVLLFSGHHRIPAIALYKSLGFQLKNSGLYRLILD